MIDPDITQLPQAYILSQRGFADWLLDIQYQAEYFFDKEKDGALNRTRYPNTYDRLQKLHTANYEIAASFAKREETRTVNEPLRGNKRFCVEDVVVIDVPFARKNSSLAELRQYILEKERGH